MTSSLGHAMAFGSGKRIRSPGEYLAQLAHPPLRFMPTYLMHAKDVRTHYDATRLAKQSDDADLFAPVDVCVPGTHLVACTMISFDKSVGPDFIQNSIAKIRADENIQATFFHHHTFEKKPDGTLREKGTFTHYMIGVPLIRPAILVNQPVFDDMNELAINIQYDRMTDIQIAQWTLKGYPDHYYPKYGSLTEFLVLQKNHEAKRKAERVGEIEALRHNLSSYFDAGILKPEDGRMVLDKNDPLNYGERERFVQFALNEGMITHNDLPLSDQNNLKQTAKPAALNL